MLLRVLSSSLRHQIVSPVLRSAVNPNLLVPRFRNCTPNKIQVKSFRSNFRKYNNEPPKDGESRYRSGPTVKDRLMGPPTENAFGMGKGAVAGAAAIGLGALCFYGLGMGKDNTIYNKSKMWPQYVRDRIHAVYLYFGGACAITAVSAYYAFGSPRIMDLVTRQGWLALAGIFIVMVGSGAVAQSIPYKPGFGAKQLAWMAHCAIMGAIIAPICILGGPIVSRAALYAAGLVGGLSALAVCAPNDKFLFMGGPLAIGLGIMFAASIANMFLPPTTALGAGIASLWMYGGLILFSLYLLHHTQRIVAIAEAYPPDRQVERIYDPINQSLSIYMDTLNIFVRIAMILASNQNNNSNKKRRK